jgi:transposase
MITERKRSAEFLEFLEWITNEVYADKEHIFLFMDNCSIHKTKAVQAFYASHTERVTVIWNATYAPNLNDIERVWGHVKRSSVNNYYFETVENLEKAVLRAVGEYNRRARNRNLNRPMFHSLRKAA